MVWMMLSTTERWLPFGLSSRNLIMRHFDTVGSQCTSTIRSSTCSPDFLSLETKSQHFIQTESRTKPLVQMRCEPLDKGASTHFSHSSSSTNISSNCSYRGLPRSSPHQTNSKNKGFARKSGFRESCGNGGKRRTSLKSIEFSEGGFHFRLPQTSGGRRNDSVSNRTHILVSVPGVYGVLTHV